MGHIEGCLTLKTGNSVDCHCADEERHYWILFFLSFLSAFIQIAGSLLFSRSLAVLSDGMHSASDMMENLLSAFIARKARVSRREEPLRRTGAFLSAASLLAVSFLVLEEALGRLRSPEIIDAGIALWTAIVGLAINVVQAIKHESAHEEHKNLTHKMQWLHLAFDILGSVVAITGVVCVMYWGLILADTVASLVIVGLIWFRTVKVMMENSGLHNHHHHDHCH